ncbi:hypothetical protein [Streptomyces harbinensis]
MTDQANHKDELLRRVGEQADALLATLAETRSGSAELRSEAYAIVLAKLEQASIADAEERRAALDLS